MVIIAAHNINISQRNDYIYTLLFFYLRLAKNVYLEIFLGRQKWPLNIIVYDWIVGRLTEVWQCVLNNKKEKQEVLNYYSLVGY